MCTLIELISPDINVADAFIIKVVSIPTSVDSSSPSQELETTEDLDFSAVYLVEKHRSSTVYKYSGTLGASSDRSQRTATVAAFAHFVMENSGCQYMFADIQGASR